ncbi:hypothetical protein DXG01_012578 [Tephrocybe rancida]|nr:hypothetical protein DXG01_012578 [Tephrocybe rancida]
MIHAAHLVLVYPRASPPQHPSLPASGALHRRANHTSTNTHHLQRLLGLHAASLTHLVLHIRGLEQYSDTPAVDEWYAQPALHARLPNLKSHDVSLLCFPSAPHRRIPEALRADARGAGALRSVRAMAPRFGPPARDHPLETLTLCVDRLDSQLLCLLRARLPRLRTFAPKYFFNSAPALSYHVDISSFGDPLEWIESSPYEGLEICLTGY